VEQRKRRRGRFQSKIQTKMKMMIVINLLRTKTIKLAIEERKRGKESRIRSLRLSKIPSRLL
jgi:hypothetical protein